MEYEGSILERWASPMAQQVKIPPAMQEPQEMWVQFLGWEDPLEEEMATHSSILAWIIPWTEEPGGPQSMWSQTVGHNWLNTHSTSLHDSDAFVLANHPYSTKWYNSLLESDWSLVDGGQRHGSLCWVPRCSVLPVFMPWCPGRLFYSPRYLFWHHQGWTALQTPGPRQLTQPSSFSETAPWMLPGDRNQNTLLVSASSFLCPLRAHHLSSASLSRCRGCLRWLHVCLLEGHPENNQAGLLPTVMSVTPSRPSGVTGRRNHLKTLTEDHLLDPSIA